MILEFPGTRGEIEESTKKHRYHSSLIVKYKDTEILIDYGEKHSKDLEERINSFDAIFITHAHPDHYIWTLKEEKSVTIPVYLTKVAYDYSNSKPVNYKILKSYKTLGFKDLNITPFEVIHSLRCPAVGYRIEADKNIFYAPDLIDTQKDKKETLKNIDCLVGDGSSLYTNMVRKRNGKLYGHTRVKTEINWCKKYGIKKFIVTHCGKQIVTMEKEKLEEKISEYSENSVNVKVAYDGYSLKL